MTDIISKEMEEMSFKMEKSAQETEFSIDILKSTILSLGADGLKKVLPTLDENQKEILKSLVQNMNQEKHTTEPKSQTTPAGDQAFNQDERPEFTKEDEEVAEEARKKEQQKIRHQGGNPIEGWEGQEIPEGGKEPTAPTIKLPGILKASKPGVLKEFTKEEAKEGHSKKAIKELKELSEEEAEEIKKGGVGSGKKGHTTAAGMGTHEGSPAAAPGPNDQAHDKEGYRKTPEYTQKLEAAKKRSDEGFVSPVTRSGKHVGHRANHPDHHDWTAEDHDDAMEYHRDSQGPLSHKVNQIEDYKMNGASKPRSEGGRQGYDHNGQVDAIDKIASHKKQAQAHADISDHMRSMKKSEIKKAKEMDKENSFSMGKLSTGLHKDREIGTTTSGKKVFNDPHHEEHESFDDQDHEDAESMHQEHAGHHENETREGDHREHARAKEHHAGMSNVHGMMAQRLAKAEKLRKEDSQESVSIMKCEHEELKKNCKKCKGKESMKKSAEEQEHKTKMLPRREPEIEVEEMKDIGERAMKKAKKKAMKKAMKKALKKALKIEEKGPEHFAVKEKKKEVKKNLKKMMGRMQERGLAKSLCVPALSNSLQIEESRVSEIWDLMEKSLSYKYDDGTVGESTPEAKQVKSPSLMENEEDGEVIEEDSPEVPSFKDKSAKKKKSSNEPLSGKAEQSPDSGEQPPKTMEKSYFFQDNPVYMAKSENPFAVRTVGKTPTYSVDAFIELDAASKKDRLAKSTFDYLGKGEEVLSKAKTMKKGEEGMEEMNPVPPILKDSTKKLKVKKPSMDDMVEEDMRKTEALKKETEIKNPPVKGSKDVKLVKSHSDVEMDELFKSTDMWANGKK